LLIHMKLRKASMFSRLAIGLVWFLNGLVCKVLGMVPRHEDIVARILGGTFAHEITLLIGFSEMAMACWVWSKIYSKLSAWTQIALVGTMNILEFLLARDLLLWGAFNSIFALAFMAFVYFSNNLGDVQRAS
jgi:hypothetical protein